MELISSLYDCLVILFAPTIRFFTLIGFEGAFIMFSIFVALFIIFLPLQRNAIKTIPVEKPKKRKIMTKLFREFYPCNHDQDINNPDIYRVRLYIDCEYQAGADYITDEYNDAIIEEKCMKEKAQISDKTTDIAKAQQALYIERLQLEQIK